MNFKRFGLGKQLINPSVATYGKYIDNNGIEQMSSSGLGNHTDYISVTANRLYTVSYSKPPVSGNTIAISWYDSNKIFIKRDSEIMPFELGRYKFTKTAPNNSAFAIVNFTYFSAYTETQNTHNYIFAIGESQLPYEPYGNTWTDIPYYIMGTSTDTITTLPADLYADGNNATVGLVGNMSQSGTPTPQNPITPSECGERTANLFDKENTGLYFYNTSLGQGNKWITSTSGVVIRISCSPSTQYTLSLRGEYSQTVWNIELTNTDSTPSAGNNVTTTAITITKPPSLITTFTTLSDTKYILVQLSQAYISTGGASNIMLNTGSTALPYEPYGYKIPISSAGQTTPVYLGEVQSTRRIKQLVLTGDELITYNTKNDLNKRFAVTVPLPLSGTSVPDNVISTHLKPLNSISVILLQTGICMRANANDIIIAMSYDEVGITSPTDATTIETAVKSYLAAQYAAGTPVCVWYVLATPTTGIVNEPIRKIGDYADTVSGITIPTIAGANSFDVLTTLKPSEVTANYHGWHTGAVHERDSGAWD